MMRPFGEPTRRNIAERCAAFARLPESPPGPALKRAAVAITLVAAEGADGTALLLTLRAAGSRPPLFYYDSDVNGGGLYARFLTAALDPEQPIYVVRPNGALGDAIPESIDAMAAADAGYRRALTSILDANVTTMISAFGITSASVRATSPVPGGISINTKSGTPQYASVRNC